MGIWKATTVDITPELKLTQWRIFEVESSLWEGKSRHFCGYNLTEREGRVSSEIVSFNKENMTGITKSGRVYKLTGDSGFNKDALYVWGIWSARNDISECIDISETFN